ncbi:MAG: hypothetical protein WA705_05340 [Candidatus Ozemobacteraceae bacterium]
MKLFLVNEVGGLPADLPSDAIFCYLVGLCDHLRQLGAIYHPELEGFIKDGTDTYYFHRQKPPIMPKWGPSVRVPGFPGEKAGKRYLQIVKPFFCLSRNGARIRIHLSRSSPMDMPSILIASIRTWHSDVPCWHRKNT